MPAIRHPSAERPRESGIPLAHDHGECHQSDGKSAAKNGTKRGTRRHWPAAIGTTWHKNDHYILVVGGRSLTSVKGIGRTKPAAMSRLVVLPR